MGYFDYTEIALNDDEYNSKVVGYGTNFFNLNSFVMSHTLAKCKLDDYLQKAIKETLSEQFIVFDEDDLKVERDGETTNIIVSGKRSFEAASAYKGKKVAVLNFANSHSVGGSPFSAGAQEESLCRTSTLYPCLLNEEKSFYEYHRQLFDCGKLNKWGNDDLIYSPGIVVFKTDVSAPEMMKQEDWFKVDVITSAAPEFRHGYEGFDFDWGMGGGLKRLRKVFEVAKKQGVEVLILGAWGCGAFGNPPTAVAATFDILCREYKFETIEFAIDCSRGPSQNFDIFKERFSK